MSWTKVKGDSTVTLQPFVVWIQDDTDMESELNIT